MGIGRTALTIGFFAGQSLLAAGAAHGAVLGLLQPQALEFITFRPTSSCTAMSAINAGTVNPVMQSKTSAILGGAPSRLESIALQQSQLRNAMPVPAGLRSDEAVASSIGDTSCPAAMALPLRSNRSSMGAITNQERNVGFLASKRLEIRHSPFDQQWARVSNSSIGVGRSTVLGKFERRVPGLATLNAVNAWANAHIRYVEDQELYGRADFWANARTTMRRGAGDCEDIAIVKFQLLAALGVRKSDMVLTVARDLVRNADHAMLIVQLDGKDWLLDNSTPTVLDAAQSYDYRPIVSYSGNRKWLHGY